MLQSPLSDNVTLSQQPLRALICLFVKWWEWSKWLWGSASTLKSGVLPCQININIQPLHCAEESRRPRDQMGIRPHCAPSLSHHLRQHDAWFYVPACLGHREPRCSVKRYSECVCEGDSGWDWQQTEWSRPPSAAWLGLTPPTKGTGRTKRLRKGEFTFHLPHWPHSAFRQGLRLELIPSALLLLRPSDSDQNYIIHSPGKILGLHSLHNHISQFIKINLFLDLPGLTTSYILTNPL